MYFLYQRFRLDYKITYNLILKGSTGQSTHTKLDICEMNVFCVTDYLAIFHQLDISNLKKGMILK